MLKQKLCAVTKEVLENQSMKEYTTFKIGGNADFLVQPSDEKQITDILRICRELSVPCHIIGNGSNLLVSDKGIRGVVMRIARSFSSVEVSENFITAQAGALLSFVASKALQSSLTGLEFASGIPGTLGGAVIMNAGAYDGEMKDVVTEVSYIDENLNLCTTKDCGFSYRHSIFQDTDCIITSVKMELLKGDAHTIKERMDYLSSCRRDKQPLTMPSAGSAFKRPENGYAAKMIDEAGLRGFTVGGASVSEKHTGFIVNSGNATAEDVLSLMRFVKEKVYEKFGVHLTPEVKFIGEK